MSSKLAKVLAYLRVAGVQLPACIDETPCMLIHGPRMLIRSPACCSHATAGQTALRPGAHLPVEAAAHDQPQHASQAWSSRLLLRQSPRSLT